MRRTALVTLAAITLTGCGSGDDSESTQVSPGCLQSMATADAETDNEAADPLIRATLDACSTYSEWLAALTVHPGAVGLTSRADLSIAIESACYEAEDTPVCVDAVAQGAL